MSITSDEWQTRVNTAFAIAADPSAFTDAEKLEAVAVHFDGHDERARRNGEDPGGTLMQDFVRSVAERMRALETENAQLRTALAGHLFDGESLDAREKLRVQLLHEGILASEQVRSVKMVCAVTLRTWGEDGPKIVTTQEIDEALDGMVATRVHQALDKQAGR